MRDSVFPNSSLNPTPCYENDRTSSNRPYSTASSSIIDLSEHFNQHSLTPRRPNVSRERSTPRDQESNPSLHSANAFSDRVCCRRQSLARLKCTSTHLSRISAHVEDMVQTGLPTYDPIHSKLMLHDSTSPSLSPDEQLPSASSYFSFTPRPTSSSSVIGSHGYSSAQHSSPYSQSYKIDKDLRYPASRDAIGGMETMVKKKIRIRKSSKSFVSRGGNEEKVKDATIHGHVDVTSCS